MNGPPPEPLRHRLPDERRAVTRHVELSWYERTETGAPGKRNVSDMYVTAGFYEDGSLAEVFGAIGKAGSTVGVLVDAWCTALSIALQHGIDSEELLAKFVGVGSGGPTTAPFATSDPEIPSCKSHVDYIARWLLLQKER